MTGRLTPAYFNDISRGHLPEYLGIVVTEEAEAVLRAELPLSAFLPRASMTRLASAGP